MSLLGGSLIGPVSVALPCKGIFLIQVWRYLPASVEVALAYPFYLMLADRFSWNKSVLSLNLEGEKKCFGPGFKLTVITLVTMVLSQGWSLGLTWGSINTVAAHAYVLTCMHSPFLVLYYLFTCKKLHWLELAGTAVTLFGAFFMILDPKALKYGEEVDISTSLICVLANFPALLFWHGLDLMKKSMSQQLVVFLMLFIPGVMCAIAAVVFEDARLDASNSGVFGFLAPENLVISWFWAGFMC